MGKYTSLSDEQVDHFMQHGWVRIPQAFPREKAQEWTSNIWTRLGMEPDDKSTWTRDWTNMPAHRKERVETFSPKAWAAMSDLCGGHDRIKPGGDEWGDSIIANLGKPEYVDEQIPHPKELDRWHCDGDFFLHFLDSPEQALLVVPLFSDIVPHAGGTMIAPQSVGIIARYLADHPEGVLPMGFGFPSIRDKCDEFVELTGDMGDVILMHPLMMHSATHNNLRIPRFITNPAPQLKEPFHFKRANVDDYSLVELKTLQVLGVDPKHGFDYKNTEARRAIVPARVARQEAWKKEETERLRLANLAKAEAAGAEMMAGDVGVTRSVIAA